MFIPDSTLVPNSKLFLVYNKDLIEANKEGLSHSKHRTLRIKKLEFIQDTLEDSILMFFSNFNHKCTTIELNGNIQCHSGKNRSSGDLFRILKVYYPELTINEVMQCLFKLCQEDKIRMTYCHQVEKRVFNSFWNYASNRQNLYKKHDEYNLSFYEWENV